MSSAARCAVALTTVGLLSCACTSSGGRGTSTTTSTSMPAWTSSKAVSGPGAGSAPTGRDTYTAPATAPYPTPGRGGSTPATQTGVLASLPGSAASTCARVGSHTNLRSGGIAMGDFQAAQRQFVSQQGHAKVAQLDLYVIPEHAKRLTAATVRIESLSPQKASTVRATNVEQAEPYSYFALTLPVPKAGTYRLNVSSGPDRGCFIASFAK